MVLHALGRQQPERKVLGLAAGVDERALPATGHVVPVGQRDIFGELVVPPVHLLLMQPIAEFLPDAHKPFLIGQLVADALLLQRRRQIPFETRHGLGPETVLLEPVEAVAFGAVRQCRGRGLADGVPDFLRLRNLLRVEAEVVVLALERRDAGDAAIQLRDILRQQVRALRKLAGDPGKIARIALRLDGLLAQDHADVIPEMLHVFRLAHADELRRFEIGRLGQQQVGHVVGFVDGVGKRRHEREFRDRAGELARLQNEIAGLER